jgi:hypothetical protein
MLGHQFIERGGFGVATAVNTRRRRWFGGHDNCPGACER